MGIGTQVPQSDGEVELSATLTQTDRTYDFANIRGTVASSLVEGRATLGFERAEKKIDVVLHTTILRLPALFSPLLISPVEDEQSAGNPSIDSALQLTRNVEGAIGTFDPAKNALMTSRPFNAERLQGIDVNLLVTADKVFLANKIMLENSEISATIKNKNIKIRNMVGRLWGGYMQAGGQLDLSSTLASAKGHLAVTSAAMENIPIKVDNAPVLKGNISLTAEFEGRGIGPSGIFALLNGKGSLHISNAKINRFSSSVLTDIVDDELQVWQQSEDQAPFKERFKRHLQHADFEISSLSQGFTITDGSAALKTSYTSTNHSKLDLEASLVLSSLITHTRLTISPMQTAKYSELPPASLVLEGPLAEPEKITAKIDTASLEQHLKVLKMEHEIDLLEKLHKRDEEFARKAAERREAAKLKREAELQAEKEKLAAQALKGQDTSAPNGYPNWLPFDQGVGGSN